jgi:hypothetical protein
MQSDYKSKSIDEEIADTKKKLADIDRKIDKIHPNDIDNKYWPPSEPNVIILDDDRATINHRITIALNTMRNEKRAPLEARLQELEVQRMEEVRKQQEKRAQRNAAAEAAQEALPILGQLDRLERSLQGHRREEKICQFCHNLNHYNHTFVDSIYRSSHKSRQLERGL